MEKSHCKKCGASIFWVLSPEGRAMPVDAQISISGNIVIADGGGGIAKAKYVPATSPAPIKYTSHFATCPDAAFFRRKRSSQSTRGK